MCSADSICGSSAVALCGAAMVHSYFVIVTVIRNNDCHDKRPGTELSRHKREEGDRARRGSQEETRGKGEREDKGRRQRRKGG